MVEAEGTATVPMRQSEKKSALQMACLLEGEEDATE